MHPRLKVLNQKHRALSAEAEALLGKETRTAEESARLDALLGKEPDGSDGEIGAVKAEVAALHKWERQGGQEPLGPELHPGATALSSGLHNLAEDKPWASFGEFLQAVAKVELSHQVDPRLMPEAAASGMGAGTGVDGGFLVRTDFSTRLLEVAREESLLLPFCAQQPIGAGFDSIEYPYFKDDDRSGGAVFGGVQVYFADEGDTVTATAPKIEKLEIKLLDLLGICYVTERLMRDGLALGSFVQNAFATAFGYKTDDMILNGNGAGQPIGILNAANGALITVTKEDGQAADTVVFENVKKMRARMPARNRRTAVWITSATVEPQLQGMYLVVGVGGVPVYMPANGVADEPFDRLYGRPVIPIEHSPVVGDAGDLLFVDLQQYVVISKGAMETAESMHVRFLNNERTFRFTYPWNGRPLARTTRTPHKGDTLSSFVALGARA